MRSRAHIAVEATVGVGGFSGENFGLNDRRIHRLRTAERPPLPENLAILRHISINILKGETTKKRGIKGKQKNAGWDHSYLLKLLRF